MAETAVVDFRNWVSKDGSSGFPVESGRYHLYISLGCPFACRCYAVLLLKGLEDAISVSIVSPKWELTKEGDTHRGWVFPESEDKEPLASPDPINHVKTVRALYDLANPKYSGKYSVPVFWDKVKRTIVNNESADIMKMFSNDFASLAAKGNSMDLAPAELQASIDEVNSWVGPAINSGVYKCGFATEQGDYNLAVGKLFKALDKCEEILSKQRFIAGSAFTEADIRLFVTLIRFDEVYVVLYKTNVKLVREYPNIFNYLKDVYQTGSMSKSVDMYHIKKFYFMSQVQYNPSGIIPAGKPIDYSSPHDRFRF